jgi:type I restriction enzyme S subunit
MELKHGYKQTEVGVIPEDWEVKALGEIGEVLIGLTYKPTDVRQHGTLVLRSSNIQNDTLAFEDNVFVETTIPERIRVQRGDVLVCVRNGSRDLIGKSVLLDERTEGMTFGAFMAVYRSQIGNLTSYLFQSSILKRQINEHLGATINQITNKSLNSFRIPIPPTEVEQQAIAEALSNVDGLLGGLDRLIAKKHDLKQAAMQQLLTGQTRLPGFQGEWEVKTIGDSIDLVTGFPFPSEQYCDSGIRLLRGSNVKRGATDWTSDLVQYWPSMTPSIARYELREGDLVIAMDGSLVGRSYARLQHQDLPAVLLQRVARIRSAKLDIRFLTQFVGSSTFISYCDSVKTVTAIPHISPSDIRNFTIPIPSDIAEQVAIAEVLTHMDEELEALEQRRDKTRALKQAMMQELLTGRTRLV